MIRPPQVELGYAVTPGTLAWTAKRIGFRASLTRLNPSGVVRKSSPVAKRPALRSRRPFEECLAQKEGGEPGLVPLEVLRDLEEVADVVGKVGARRPVPGDPAGESAEAGEFREIEIDGDEEVTGVGLAPPLPPDWVGQQVRCVADGGGDAPPGEGVPQPEPVPGQTWAAPASGAPTIPPRPPRPRPGRPDRRRTARARTSATPLERDRDLRADHEGVGDARPATRMDDVLDVGLHREPGRKDEGVGEFQDRLGGLPAQVAAENAVVGDRGEGVLAAPGPHAAVDGAGRREKRHGVDLLVGRRDEGAPQREPLAAAGRTLPIDDLVELEIESPVASPWLTVASPNVGYRFES